MADWRHIRAHKISSERPNDWPRVCSRYFAGGVKPSWDQRSNWPAILGRQPVRTRNMLRLGTPERWIAAFAAAGAFGTFAVNAARFVIEKLL